jgi:hypothetical protein
MPSQLSAVLQRKIPTSRQAQIQGSLSTLYSSLGASDQEKYQEQQAALAKQSLDQSAAYNQASLSLQAEQQKAAEEAAAQSTASGIANIGLTAGLGAAKYYPQIKNALGFGEDAIATGAGASGNEGVPVGLTTGATEATALTGTEALTGTTGAGVQGMNVGLTSGAAEEAITGVPAAVSGGSEGAATSGLGLSGGLASAGWGAAGGTVGGWLANQIGGGTSTTTRSAKGAAGGAVGGALAGAAATSWSGPGAIIGGPGGAVVGAVSSGRVICTKLNEYGILPDELYHEEARWSLEHKSATTIRGYHWWAVPFVARFMDGNRPFCIKVARVAFPYSRYLSWRAGRGKFNLAGFAVDIIGSAACWCIGQFVKYDKVNPVWDREDSERLEGVNHA